MTTRTSGEGKVGRPPTNPEPQSMLSLLQDIEVEREDQQRINLFARKNARLVDIREKIAEKEVRTPPLSLIDISLLNSFTERATEHGRCLGRTHDVRF